MKVDDKVTCLVGKNESGKSAFLSALWRLDPARRNPTFSIPDHYPAWLEKRHRNEGKDLEEVQPIEVQLEWEPDDVTAIERAFGPGVIKAGTLQSVFKCYDNKFRWTNNCDEHQAVKNFVGKNGLPSDPYATVPTFEDLTSLLNQDSTEEKETPEKSNIFSNAQATLKTLFGKEETFRDAVWKIVYQRIPQFFYFSDYSKLPYSVKIDRVLEADDLDESEATARALLKLGGTEDEYMLNPDYERRKRELENVANVLTEDVNEYWSQNPELRVQPDITQRTEQRQNGQHSVLDEMKIRIWDNRHSLSLPFTEHSAGFQWFFSCCIF